MLLHIVIIADFGVKSCIDPSAEEQFEGLGKVIHSDDCCAVLLCELGICAGDRVCSGLSLQVLELCDRGVVGLHYDSGLVVAVRYGEIILLLSVLREVHAVDHHVIAS